METDLAGVNLGLTERFAPDQDHGRLIEAEHISRYLWAAQAAHDRTVLDAGCGTAYGSRLLAEGGAREVVGVDVAKSVLDAVAATMPDTVRLDEGDLRKLAYENGAFDLVVCFDAIEQFEDAELVLDELVRVLAPDGLLLVSSPDWDLEAELAARLEYVRVYRQGNFIVSAVLDEEARGRESAAIDELQVRRLVGGSVDEAMQTVAMASNGTLSGPPEVAVMAGTLELREWLTVFRTQTDAIAEKDHRIAELETRVAERDRVAELLVGAEQRLADVPELQLRIADLEYQLAEERKLRDEARDEARDLDERLMRARRVQVELMNSPSWKVTKPLRAAKQLLRR